MRWTLKKTEKEKKVYLITIIVFILIPFFAVILLSIFINTQKKTNLTSLDEDSLRLVQALNLATVSIKKIISTRDRFVLDQEYNNIIHNLALEKVKAEGKMADLYEKIMDAIAQFNLNKEEKTRFLYAFERNKRIATWRAIGGTRAYGANPFSFLLSLGQSVISAYFNYKDVQAQMKEELDRNLWEIKKDEIEEINKLWQEWLRACWDASDKYGFEGKNLYVIRGGILDDYISGEQEPDVQKAMRKFEDLERNSLFLGSYPPYWLSYAIVAEKAGNKAKRDQCLDNFFKYHREILNRDPYLGRACVMRLRTIIEKPSALQDKNRIKEIEELLIKADRHLDKTDGHSRIFISAIYQKLGKPDEARRILQLNIDRNVDKDISQLALDNLNNGREVASGIPQVLAMLILKDNLESGKDLLTLEELQKLAEQGEPNAMAKLGERYLEGKGVPQDYDKARQWFEKAAGKGIAYAMYKLGWMYAKGKGVPQDYAKTRQWYEKSAEKGYANAMARLGEMYLEGKGVPQDYDKARQWFEKSAEKANASAMNNLGVMYKNGKGVPQDYDKARQWFEKSAEKGNAYAMNNLGEMYKNGKGVPQDYDKARQWYEKSAEKGNDRAMFNLGWMYYEGLGVPQDYDKARQWFEKSAEKGNADAMFNLGWMYAKGKGVPQDYEKARQWYEKSAEKGNADAMNNLGGMYKNGQGVPQDYDKARQWYEKSAEKGNASAMYNLGVMYEYVLGVPMDRVLAYAWYTLAMKYAGEDEDSDTYNTAKKNRDNLGITEEELKEAKELVNNYKPGTILKRKNY